MTLNYDKPRKILLAALQSRNDFEINRMVAEILGLPVSEKQHFWDSGIPVVRLDAGYGGYFDPCNESKDSFKIILENKIAISPVYKFTDDTEEDLEYTGLWEAGCTRIKFGELSLQTRDPNPLRAAMMIFIAVRELYK